MNKHAQKKPLINKNDDFICQKVICDEFKRELAKNDICIDKWYHKLLNGCYFKSNGSIYHDDDILKRLSAEYQKAIHIRNIDSMLLIKNELLNHFPEQLWIHKYLSGQVYNASGHALNKINPEIESLSKEYMQIYEKIKDIKEM
jgi:hypothetical protein